MATSYQGSAPAGQRAPATARLVAIVWASVNVVAAVVAGIVAYFGTVSVLLPCIELDMAAWGTAMGRRWAWIGPCSAALALVLHLLNRAVFGWVHAGEEAPEPGALLRLFVFTTAVGLVVGSGESLLINAPWGW